MKKLLITTMAAVSVGLCAKAEDYTKTSFENYAAGDALLINAEDKGDVWTSLATDPLFVISNLTDFAKGSKASRPDFWANENDLRALTIDTDAPLFCHLKNDTNYDLSNGPMFFDSVVQFTATDVAAEPEGLDKLRVWLYASPEDSEGRLFNETQPITNLVITAGYYDNDGNKVSTNYLTNVSIQPDTWHRLTIKAINNIEIHTLPTPGFEVYVDGDRNPVSGKCDYVGDNPVSVTKFPSLVARNNNGENSLQCVAFDGKGAVDDIVFTTTDPFAEAEPEKFTINIEDIDNYFAILSKRYCIDDGDFVVFDPEKSISIPVGSAKVKFEVTMDSTSGNFTIAAKLGDNDLDVTKSGDVCTFEVNVENTAADATLSVSYTAVPYAGGSAWKDNENFAADLTTNVDGLLAKVYNQVTGEPTDEQAAYLMTTVGTASGVVTVKVGGETKAAADKFELSVGNNVKIQVPYYEVTDGVVKVATAIIALETVEITVGDESKTISPVIMGVLSVTGITSEENVVGELSNNVATVKVRDTTDPIKLAFDGVVPTDVFFTKKVYTKADASTTVAYGMTGLDDSAFWFYFQYGQNLDDLRSVWNGGSVNYKIGCYNKGIANVVMNITIDQQFTVKFKNGETVVQSTDVWNGEYVTAPSSNPEAPTGQQFVGWFNDNAMFDATVPVTANVNYTAKFEDMATYPSVGGVTTPEYSVNAKDAIDAAFPNNNYPAGGLTVKVNGEVLAGAKAVEMLNDAVDMFTLTEEGAKFFNAQGELDISFKATSADPTKIAYEAKVGGSSATVKGTYEVVPKYIDIATNTELQAMPTEGSVTFRLVIKPVGQK